MASLLVIFDAKVDVTFDMCKKKSEKNVYFLAFKYHFAKKTAQNERFCAECVQNLGKLGILRILGELGILGVLGILGILGALGETSGTT